MSLPCPPHHQPHLCKHHRDGEEAPDIDSFSIGRLREVVGDLLVEGVEHQQRRQGHHDTQVDVLSLAEEGGVAN